MRAFTKKSIKDLLQNETEKKLVDLIVYNIGRNEYPRFEEWFDKKEKLNITKIYDCQTGIKINWKKFGNFSMAKSYTDFLKHSRFRDGDNIDGVDLNRIANSRTRKGIPNIFDSGKMTLGSYKRMASPGIIRLNIDNIQISFWTKVFKLICKKNYSFTREKIEELAKLAIYKTLFHELFHHFIDVQSYLSENYRYDFETDEALAVAFSRIQIGYETKNHSYISDYLDLAYSYTLDGYKDWVKYKGEEQFIHELIKYIAIDRDLITLGQEITPIVEGLLYSVIENSNAEVNISF